MIVYINLPFLVFLAFYACTNGNSRTLLVLSNLAINATLPLSYPPFRPIASIKVSITYRFGNVGIFYLVAGVEVGNGAGHFEDAAVSAGGEREAFHGIAQGAERLLVGGNELLQHLLGHLRVAMYAFEVFETFCLYLAGCHDALADSRTGFAGRSLGEFGERDCGYFALYVYTVEYS